MPINIRGTPAVFTAETAASATGDADLIIRPPVEEASIQQLVSNVLAAMEQDMWIMVDTATRRVYATDNSTQHGSYVTAVTANDAGGVKACQFDANGGDRVTEWEITNSFPAGAIKTALDNIVAPVAPKYSVASLLTRIFEVFDGAAGNNPFIEIDQPNGAVYVRQRSSAAEESEASAALVALTPVANTKTMAFNIPVVTAGADQFFE